VSVAERIARAAERRAGALAERARPARILQQRAPGAGQRRRIARGHEPAGHALLHALADPAHVGGHHRHSAGQRLEQRVGERVGVARHHEQIGAAEQRGHLRLAPLPQQVHAMAEAVARRGRGEGGLAPARAGQHQVRPRCGAGPREGGERRDEVIDPLVGSEPADEQDQRRPIIDDFLTNTVLFSIQSVYCAEVGLFIIKPQFFRYSPIFLPIHRRRRHSHGHSPLRNADALGRSR